MLCAQMLPNSSKVLLEYMPKIPEKKENEAGDL